MVSDSATGNSGSLWGGGGVCYRGLSCENCEPCEMGYIEAGATLPSERKWPSVLYSFMIWVLFVSVELLRAFINLSSDIEV